nr:putative uncharacterized protein DDB_G0290521 [Halyomorpha halys]
MFISNPTRCMVCCRFGHTKLKCKKEPICRYCGKAKHEGTQCSSPLKCVNCPEHDSFSKTCKAFLKEKEIRSIQDMDKISYMAAKKTYESLHPLSSQITFSNIVKKQKKVSVSVQTDELDKVFVFKKSSETTNKPSLVPGLSGDSNKSGTPTPLLLLFTLPSPTIPVSTSPIPLPSTPSSSESPTPPNPPPTAYKQIVAVRSTDPDSLASEKRAPNELTSPHACPGNSLGQWTLVKDRRARSKTRTRSLNRKQSEERGAKNT